MFKVYSQSITDDYKVTQVPYEQWKFQIENGNTGSMLVSDPLLENEAQATERAMAEFINNSYKIREVKFTTYRTDITKNMIILVKGVDYIVKGITTTIDAVGIKSLIKAERYE